MMFNEIIEMTVIIVVLKIWWFLFNIDTGATAHLHYKNNIYKIRYNLRT